VIDKAILGFNYHGYYVTINFITSTVTTLFGAWTGNLIRTRRPLAGKLRILALGSLAAFVGGLALSPLVPMVKRLWTASFTLYSAGWVLLMMLAFVVLIEVWGVKKPAFPLVVVGMNSIFIYSAGFLVKGSVDNWISAFSGGFKFVGKLAPVAQNCAVMLVLWYLCYWLYKRRIFLKV
jgi:predicted acyltransferase